MADMLPEAAGLRVSGIPSTSRSNRRLSTSGIRIVPPPLQLSPAVAWSQSSPHSPSFSRHVETHAIPHPDFLPPLPRTMLPAGMRRQSGPSGEGVDPSVTEAEAREKLSDWVIYRFEKDQFDDKGYPIQPVWDHVTRAKVTGYSRREVARMVRDLDRKTLPVHEKMAGFSEPIQRQLNLTLDELVRSESDPRYQYALAQLDCELREREPSGERDPHKHDRKQSLSRRKLSSSSRPSSPLSSPRKSKSKTRRTLERVSVTAYFKRAPRTGEDVLSMYRNNRNPGSAARLFPISRHHRHHGRSHSSLGRYIDVGHHQSPRSTQPPPSPSSHSVEQRRRRYSETIPKASDSVPVQPRREPTPSFQISPRGFHEPLSARDSPKTSRSSLCSDDAFSAGDMNPTPLSSVDETSPLRKSRHIRFRSRSPSRERPRPPPRTRSPSPARADGTWAGSEPKTSSHAPTPLEFRPRSLPVDNKHLRPGRFEPHRGSELRESERDQDRRRDRDSEWFTYATKQDSPVSPASPRGRSPSRSHRRRAGVRFIGADEWDVGSDGAGKDIERRAERLSLGGEHRVRFSDEPESSSSRRDLEYRRTHDNNKRRSADFSRYPDGIFYMDDVA